MPHQSGNALKGFRPFVLFKPLFFAIFVPLSLLIAGLAVWYWQAQESIVLEHYRTEARHHVEGQLNRVGRFYRQAGAMLLALARDREIIPAMDGDHTALTGMQRLFTDVIEASGLYDQIRLLDRQGHEVVRVERRAGSVHVAATGELQNKAARDYVQRALSVQTGEIYISPFDLNMEHGRVQQPFKATVRFATPLALSQEGRRHGLLVLNLAGMPLMKRELNDTILTGEHLLMNSGSSYWFDRVDGGLNVTSDAVDATVLPRRFPAAWRRIVRQRSGQFLTPAGLFTYGIKTSAMELKHVASGKQPWHVVSFASQAALAASIGRTRAFVLPVSIVCILLTGAVSFALSGWAANRRDALQKLRSSEELFRHLVDLNADPMLIHHQNRIVYANPAAIKQLGENSLGKIRDTEVLGRLHPDDRSLAVSQLEQAAREGVRTNPVEVRFRRLDGQWITIEWVSCPFEFEHRSSVLSVWHDITERKRVDKERERLLCENQRLSQGLIRSREEERKRVARALHDDIGQILTAMQMKAAFVSSHCKDKKCSVVIREVNEIQHLAAGLIDTVRGQLKMLRPPQLDEIGLKGALQSMVQEWRGNTGIDYHLTVTDAANGLDAETQINLYRMVQEALSNVARHAGASRVSIHLRVVSGGIRLSVKDNGRGFDPRAPTEGIGLAGMRERAAALGGEMRIESTVGEETRLTCRIPPPSGVQAYGKDR